MAVDVDRNGTDSAVLHFIVEAAAYQLIKRRRRRSRTSDCRLSKP
jgi:hypothetical protein